MHALEEKFIVKEFSIQQPPKSHHKCQTFLIKKNPPKNVNVAFQTQNVCFDF